MIRSKITGVGRYVPEQVVSNHDFEKLIDTTNEWIVERSGVKERRFFKEGHDTVSIMGARAAKVALDMAGLNANDIDMIVFATLSPDYYFPGSGVLLQRELGIKNIPAFDIRQQCSGFLYGLSLADQYIKTGMSKRVLLVGAEIQSNIFEMSNRNRNVAILFGDGAGAVIIESTDKPEQGILSTHLHADGTYAEELMVEGPSSSKKTRLSADMIENGAFIPHMNGQLVFKNAVKRFPEVINEAIEFNKLTIADVDLFIPHQANLRISNYICQKMGVPKEKVFNNIQKYGNTTAASIPIAISEAVEQGRLKKGDLLCLAAFGSGFTWASALIKW